VYYREQADSGVTSQSMTFTPQVWAHWNDRCPQSHLPVDVTAATSCLLFNLMACALAYNQTRLIHIENRIWRLSVLLKFILKESVKRLSLVNHKVSWGEVRLSPLGTSATNSLIIPPSDNRLWMWSSRWNEKWWKKQKYSEKTCPNATLSTTNPTWPDLGWNPGRRDRKPVTNRLSYGTTMFHITLNWQHIFVENKKWPSQAIPCPACLPSMIQKGAWYYSL
jgi:hypothetical protein